jgi:ketosteroid isomerase-like protein
MIQAIEAYCRAETQKDKAAWLALFAENAVHEDPVGQVKNEGLEKIAAFWDSFQPWDVELWLTEPPIVCGNEAIALMQCRTGPAHDRRLSGRIVDQMIFNEAGRITAVRAFYDTSGR